jgi:multimeric flavodoxin WrbA
MDRLDFSDLTALFVNCTLKKTPGQSHTGLLLDASAGIMERQGVAVDRLHLLSYDVPPGIYPDMTEHGWDRDDWPRLWERVLAAHILVIGTPIWLGEESAVCRTLIERLYAMSGELNDRGQSVFYGKVGGTVVTGNEDGVKHVAMSVGFALNHLGYTIPPQADCGWIGEAGPGPSYGDDDGHGGRVGFDNAFTQRNTTIMTWNLMHMARMLKGGISNEGNDRNAWSEGERFGFRNPEATL